MEDDKNKVREDRAEWPSGLEWPDEPGIFDSVDQAVIDAADARAIASIEAGRLISHAAMVRWLKSWGTANELPPPQCGE